MITREDVADLHAGDVVEMAWPEGDALVTVRGPLVAGSAQMLAVGRYWVREEDGSPIQALQKGGRRTLTVVSRAPRPLYVNHPRTEPADGDIARDRDGDAFRRIGGRWYMAGSTLARFAIDDFMPLTLLWDGETGQVVP